MSVIIPVYNEEATIAALLEKVKAVELPDGVSKEIVIVNDGSKDNTPRILSQFQGQENLIIIHQDNGGKTAAMLTGIKNAKGDIFIIQDADLEYDPVFYPKLLEPVLQSGAQVVYGSRFLGNIENMELINRWANAVSNWTINLLYHVRITDINTCYKMFTRQAMEGIVIKGSQFDMDAEMTVKFIKKGITIVEVPIGYVARSRKEGKKIKWSTAVRLYWQIIKLRFK